MTNGQLAIRCPSTTIITRSVIVVSTDINHNRELITVNRTISCKKKIGHTSRHYNPEYKVYWED